MTNLFSSESEKRSHSGVLSFLVALSILCAVGMGAAWSYSRNPAALDMTAMFILSIGLLLGTFLSNKSLESKKEIDREIVEKPVSVSEEPAKNLEVSNPLLHRLKEIKFGTACIAGLILYSSLLAKSELHIQALSAMVSGVFYVILSALSFMVGNYFSTVDRELLPEASGLSQGARVLAWGLLVCAGATASEWLGWLEGVRIAHITLVLTGTVACVELFVLKIRITDNPPRFPTNLRIFSMLGSGTHPLGSLLDSADRQLGIDLRSSWALTIVRQSMEPLLAAIIFIGWISTAATVVGVDEEGLIEHFGERLSGSSLAPGLHLHWPLPIDRVVLLPVRRMQTLHIGHEGEEEGTGPEDVLWARRHAESEYTLLLGNGRDLIAVDAAVQFLISDPVAWRYHSQNPTDALRAIAYRAVMKSTVNRTLTDALSENVATLTAEMRDMVQADADALGLGVKVIAFTIGGMHPPVQVARDYQGVVSSELYKTTAAVGAQADANEVVPSAIADAVDTKNRASADGAEALGKAAGEAWSFQKLQPQYRDAPEEFRFRRRLEALEHTLQGNSFAVIDDRFERDGGEVWLTK